MLTVLRASLAKLWDRWTGVARITDLMLEFEAKFPGRCGFCSFYRYGLNQTPPPHEHCREEVRG